MLDSSLKQGTMNETRGTMLLSKKKDDLPNAEYTSCEGGCLAEDHFSVQKIIPSDDAGHGGEFCYQGRCSRLHGKAYNNSGEDGIEGEEQKIEKGAAGEV